MRIKEDGVIAALTRGDATTKLSAIFMGLGCAAHKQLVKGIAIFLVEIAYIVFMINKGIECLKALPGLGDSLQEKVWNEELGVFEYTAGDNSILILLYGVATLVVTAAFIVLWVLQLTKSFELQNDIAAGKPVLNFKESIASLRHQNVHVTLMSLPMIGILLFNIVPLIFMISMAFTNYSKENDKLVLFDWVGLDNFARVLNFNGNIGRQFWHVLAWTVIWAIFATFLNYIMGMILALLINRKDTRIKGFWRFLFILSIAVPQFVSLL